MSYESLEHVVRSRVRMFLRHTWLVTILGTLLLGAAVWAAIHFTMARDYMRIAAGPLDAKFVHALSNQLATDHRNLHLQIVPTTSPQATAEAMSKGEADLAVLPSQLDNARDWPVVTILRQNVMAMIVPAAGATKVEESAATKPAKKTSAKGGKSKGGESKSAKAGGKNAKGGKGTKSAKGDASDDSDSSDSKFGKVTDLAGKRVSVVSGNEATTGLLELVLSHYGVPRDNTRTRRLRLLQRVLDLVRKAHGAQNLEALEQLQVEADNLVIAIVHQGEREEFDETVRMSFAFALDQLRFAIAARRTAILDHSGTAPEATAPAAATMQTAFHGQLNRQW